MPSWVKLNSWVKQMADKPEEDAPEVIDRKTVRGRLIQHSQTTDVFAEQWRGMMTNMGVFLTFLNLYQVSLALREDGFAMSPKLAFELFSAGQCFCSRCVMRVCLTAPSAPQCLPSQRSTRSSGQI